MNKLPGLPIFRGCRVVPICDSADTCHAKFPHMLMGDRPPHRACTGGDEDHHQHERKYIGYVTLSIKILTTVFSLDLFRSLNNNGLKSSHNNGLKCLQIFVLIPVYLRILPK